jgi:cytochrome P450
LEKLPEFNDKSLMSVELLDAVINETLRLHPATPAGLQRTTSDNGLTINETYIPQNVVVTVPLYTLFRGLLTPFPLKVALSS